MVEQRLGSALWHRPQRGATRVARHAPVLLGVARGVCAGQGLDPAAGNVDHDHAGHSGGGVLPHLARAGSVLGCADLGRRHTGQGAGVQAPGVAVGELLGGALGARVQRQLQVQAHGHAVAAQAALGAVRRQRCGIVREQAAAGQAQAVERREQLAQVMRHAPGRAVGRRQAAGACRRCGHRLAHARRQGTRLGAELRAQVGAARAAQVVGTAVGLGGAEPDAARPAAPGVFLAQGAGGHADHHRVRRCALGRSARALGPQAVGQQRRAAWAAAQLAQSLQRVLTALALGLDLGGPRGGVQPIAFGQRRRGGRAIGVDRASQREPLQTQVQRRRLFDQRVKDRLPAQAVRRVLDAHRQQGGPGLGVQRRWRNAINGADRTEQQVQRRLFVGRDVALGRSLARWVQQPGREQADHHHPAPQGQDDRDLAHHADAAGLLQHRAGRVGGGWHQSVSMPCMTRPR